MTDQLAEAPNEVDLHQCEVIRPSTWPDMPSFMTLGPVSWRRCTNRPRWIGIKTGHAEGEGAMSLCDECRGVMEKLFQPGEVALVEIVKEEV